MGENGNQAEFSEKRGEKIRKMVKDSESAKSETQKSGGKLRMSWVSTKRVLFLAFYGRCIGVSEF